MTNHYGHNGTEIAMDEKKEKYIQAINYDMHHHNFKIDEDEAAWIYDILKETLEIKECMDSYLSKGFLGRKYSCGMLKKNHELCEKGGFDFSEAIEFIVELIFDKDDEESYALAGEVLQQMKDMKFINWYSSRANKHTCHKCFFLK